MRFINYNVANRVANITLNRPEKKNALNENLIAELHSSFSDAISSTSVKVIVLKATGTVFSAGADLEYLQQLQKNTFEENIADTNRLKDLFYLIYTSPKITIAQVEGDAIAGGCGLATVCDFVFSVPEAKFGYSEVRIGFIPALVSCFLLRKIGESRTRELLLSGNLIDAPTAGKYNLLNFIISKDDIAETVNSYAEKLCNSVSKNSVAQTKELLRFAWDNSLEESLEAAVHANAKARESYDCQTGIAAFLNKEKHSW